MFSAVSPADAPARPEQPAAPQISGLRGTDFAAWTLAAFTISVRAGALIRRMIPGIVAAITAWSGLLATAVFWLHTTTRHR
jgi:hypothetical protein